MRLNVRFMQFVKSIFTGTGEVDTGIDGVNESPPDKNDFLETCSDCLEWTVELKFIDKHRALSAICKNPSCAIDIVIKVTNKKLSDVEVYEEWAHERLRLNAASSTIEGGYKPFYQSYPTSSAGATNNNPNNNPSSSSSGANQSQPITNSHPSAMQALIAPTIGSYEETHRDIEPSAHTNIERVEISASPSDAVKEEHHDFVGEGRGMNGSANE